MDAYQKLIQELSEQGYLKTPEIIEAFRKISRADFLPEPLKADAAVNEPLPIGHGQTVSQPLTVAFMLELLDPRAGQHILDVGSGSGWQTAILAEIVGPSGHVFATEIVPELFQFGRDNVAQYGYANVTFVQSQGEIGHAAQAPYDRIVVAAAAPQIPAELKDQLAVNGRMVLPVGGRMMQDIVVVDRVSEQDFSEIYYSGFRFVPLVKKT